MNLYSSEYFTLLKEHLAPGGFAVSWAPTERVVRTFVKVFPHAMLYDQAGVRVLIGGNEPFAWNCPAAAARLRSDYSRAYYARADVPLADYLDAFASARPKTFTPEYDRAALTDLNTDLFPKDEYLVR